MNKGKADKTFEINSFALKIIAIAAMTCNHVANVFGPSLPGVIGFILYSLGGMTFPVMAFMLVEGYTHTSSIRNYALRLLAFAIVSQVPYSLLWGATPNVMFTLLVGLGVLWLSDNIESRPAFIAVFLAIIVFTANFDWGSIGIVVIYCFKHWNDDEHGALKTTGLLVIILVLSNLTASEAFFEWFACLTQLGCNNPTGCSVPVDSSSADFVSFVGFTGFSQSGFAILCEMGYAVLGCGCAGVLLNRYNGKRGRSLKWFFYAYYPAHLFIIWIISRALGVGA